MSYGSSLKVARKFCQTPPLMLGAAAIVIPVSAAHTADSKASKEVAEKKAAKPDGQSNLVPLYRFYDEKLHEHVYTYGDEEPVAWLLEPKKRAEAVIGYASTTPLAGTRRLFRAARPDGLHYFYFQAPVNFLSLARLTMKEIRPESFAVHVWARKMEGMVPIHACCLPDGTDMFLDPDIKKVRRFAKEAFTGHGVEPLLYPAAFHLYEKPPAAAGAQKR